MRKIPIQAAQVEATFGIHVEIIPSEPQEPDEMWPELHYIGKVPLGDGGYRILPKKAQE